MNKTTVAQQAKTGSYLPPAQGILQRQCACGNHTVAGGDCAECAKNKSGLQRKLAIGANNDPLEQAADRVTDQVLAAPVHPASSGAVPPIVHEVLHSPGKLLDPATRVFMEPRFGHDFSGVRVHTDSRAIESAQAIQARAYAIGSKIVFGKGHYAPHTAGGQRLIAHELAHTIQQNENGLRTGHPFEVTQPSDTAEREADKAADAVASAAPVTVTPHSLSRIGRDLETDPEGIPKLHEKVRKELHDEAYFDLLNEIGNPKLNKTSLLGKINYLDPAELEQAVDLMGNRFMTELAGSAAGVEVLQAIKSRLPKGPRVNQLDLALNARSNGPEALPISKVTPDDQKALDRINSVLVADPHYSDYRKGSGQPGRPGPIIPLSFPFEIYSPGREVDGGVYYDPNLTETGQTPLALRRFTVNQGKSKKITRAQNPLVFIRLGPAALGSSDSFLQSTMWHEFQHYQRVMSFRQADADKSLDVKSLEQEAETSPGEKSESAETEAYSIELADYFDQLSDSDAQMRLFNMAEYFEAAHPDFKQAAIDRLRNVVAKQPDKKARLLKLIDTITNKTRRANLKELRKAIAKA